MKITATVITLNEEQVIARCLQSLQGIVDEIIVVDSFSTDGTKKICMEYGVRFIEHAFEGYIEQKNYAAGCAENDVILSLDADEVLSDPLRASILAIKTNWSADGYCASRTTFLGNRPVKHGSWYPDYKLRLFDRRKGRFGGTNPHDGVIMDDTAHVKRIKGTILHYSFNSLDDFYRQSDHFATLAARAMYAKGKKANYTLQLLKTGWAFCKSYFIKLGFLDGKIGFTISRVIAAYTCDKYRQLRALQRKPV